MGFQTLGRPLDKHIDGSELNALVLSRSETGAESQGISPDSVRAAVRHLESCEDCRRKVSHYQQLLNQPSNLWNSQAAMPGPGCPREEDVDWHEVAAGLWPELKSKQLIMHAALCEHCGPLLRAAASVDEDATPQEEKLLSRLSAPSRPGTISRTLPRPWRFMSWLVPAVAFMVIAGVLGMMPPASPASLSGPKFAEFAVLTHRQQFRERLAFDVRSDSSRDLNEWLKSKSPFSLALPASPAMPGEERPYHLDGARLVPVNGRTAAFIAYHMRTSPVSLIVAPDLVAVASGGTVVDYKKVSFHYNTVEGYKVVTWSVHGLTYALVSEEGNRTQTSCMVCHSDLRDRDLSHTPTPLPVERNPIEPLLQ